MGDRHITLKVSRSHLVGQVEVWHRPLPSYIYRGRLKVPILSYVGSGDYPELYICLGK